MKNKTSPTISSMNRSLVRYGLFLTPLVLAFAWFALSPSARATCQDGCLTNQNTVLGDDALLNNTTGSSNTAIGSGSLELNTTGSFNTAIGVDALFNNTTGSNNTAIGQGALFNTIGSTNIALGIDAGFALTTGSNNIYIGNAGAARESNKIRIGNSAIQTKTFIAGISGATVLEE